MWNWLRKYEKSRENEQKSEIYRQYDEEYEYYRWLLSQMNNEAKKQRRKLLYRGGRTLY